MVVDLREILSRRGMQPTFGLCREHAPQSKSFLGNLGRKGMSMK